MADLERQVAAAVARELRNAELVARITDADVERIAQVVVDRLEERLFPALAEPGPDHKPRRRGGRAKSYYPSSS